MEKIQDIKRNIKENKKTYAALFLILVLGIFLRTYHFRDWLRFSDDQARDAIIIRNVVEHRQNLPLLGPIAGTSSFYLGPAYYYIEYAAAKVFGNTPARIALPDLLLSILIIPLLFFFLKKYFSSKLSLFLTALFAVSFYAVRYARFAWNPNSTGFFVILLLYALFELFESKRRQAFWATIAGIAFGIGMQLHTLYLLVMPIVLLFFFIYGAVKKRFSWKNLIIFIAVVAVINIPQIIQGSRTNGENAKAFYHEVIATNIGLTKIIRNAPPALFCHVQENAQIVSPFSYSNTCDFLYDPLRISPYKTGVPWLDTKGAIVWVAVSLAFVFTIGGYLLLIYYLRRETDEKRKGFLALILVFSLTSYVVLIPIIKLASARFFVYYEFLPFLFLGLWAKFLLEKMKRNFVLVFLSIFAVILAAANLLVIKQSFARLAGNGYSRDNVEESSSFGEEEYLANFILKNSGDYKTACIMGDGSGLFKIQKPIRYFFQDNKNFEVEFNDKENDCRNGSANFLIKFIGFDEKRLLSFTPEINYQKILARGYFNRYFIFRLAPKENKQKE